MVLSSKTFFFILGVDGMSFIYKTKRNGDRYDP